MRLRIILTIMASLFSANCWAQHADITFSYENDVVVLREGFPGNNEGLQIFEGTFPTAGFAIRFTENPGFLAEIANGDMLLPNDGIEIEVVQSTTFGTFLTYYDPTTDQMQPTDATITIDDNAGTNTDDLVIGNTELSGVNPQFIQTADNNGEVHSHIDFSLSSDAVCTSQDMSGCGAYGFLFRLRSSNPIIADSNLVWLVFNFGMSPVDFEDLVLPAFAAANDVLLGDVNGDGIVDLLDVAPFVDLLTTNEFLPAADVNQDGVVDLLDVGPFVGILTG